MNKNIVKAILSIASVCIMMLVLCAFLTACGGHSEPARSAKPYDTAQETDATESSSVSSSNDSERFYSSTGRIQSDIRNVDYVQVIVDDDTGVEYLYLYEKNQISSSPTVSITMLSNADGTPKQSDEWLERHQEEKDD